MSSATTPKMERVPAGPAGPQVASVPPGGPPRGAGVPDMRSALRRGAGGRGEGRGGILGDPIPLDTPDPRFSDFMGQVKRQIQAKLNYPCIKNPGTYVCEPKDTQVIVQFGILKNGRLQFIELWIPSQWSDYDTSSMTAVRLAQPFPPVPPAIMATLPPGSTGIPITGRFMYQVTYSTLIQ
jgi:TonB family protein